MNLKDIADKFTIVEPPEDDEDSYLEAILATRYWPAKKKGSRKAYCKAQIAWLKNEAPPPDSLESQRRMEKTLAHFRLWAGY